MRLIYYQEIPRQIGRVARRLRCCQELLKHIGLLQVMVRRDRPLLDTPRVCVHAQAAAEFESRCSVDLIEMKRELVSHFIPPLSAKRCRTKNKYSSYSSADEQLRED